MRLRGSSEAVIFALVLGIFALPSNLSRIHASTFQTDNGTRITSARVKGRKLILTGENFAEGSVILLNGEPQKTKNDEESPSTTLIAKKAGDKIPNDAVVDIQVQSASVVTDKFPFFKGRVVTLDDASRTINLQVGEKFLLSLIHSNYEFTPTVIDESVLRRVSDIQIAGAQGVFEALRVGSTKLSAVGELPCHHSEIRCLAPTLFVEFLVIVD